MHEVVKFLQDGKHNGRMPQFIARKEFQVPVLKQKSVLEIGYSKIWINISPVNCIVKKNQYDIILCFDTMK